MAARRLTELGYTILQRNHKTQAGEIDIVAIEDDQTVFVEVKTRQRSSHVDFGPMACPPVECFTQRKAERVRDCAAQYMASSHHEYDAWRVDFVGVELGANGRPMEIEVIKNIEVD